MTEPVDIVLNYWPSFVGKLIPVGTIIFIMTQIHSDVSKSAQTFETAATGMQEALIVGDLLPLMFFIIILTMFISVVVRV